MRVLSLLAVALAGCYDPAIRDCQFTCPDNRCPGDLTCANGLCRLPGSSVSCSCPDPPSGCSLVTNDAGICLAACNAAQTWDGARTACAAAGSWQLAVLDTASTLSAGENALRSSTTWIGLHRSTVIDPWTWITGGGSIAPTASGWGSGTHGGATYTCAAINSGTLYSDECTTPYPYACTAN
jgi:hypothetical protein